MSNLRIDEYIARHNQFLENVLINTTMPAPRLKAAMHYSLFPGGKRMRPLLVYLCGELLALDLAILDIIAASIELLHTYSLVHDDLPAMDNDDFRRGQPSCHRAFDEATAILVGDALQALAIDLLLTELPPLISFEPAIKITQELLKATGPSGMLSGQSLDLTALRTKEFTLEQLHTIHQLKTGQLILACINMVLLAGHPSATQSLALQQFAQQLSAVFQIQDDYLDYYDTQLGKKRASDLANNKLTFASCMSQEALASRIYDDFQQVLTTLHTVAPKDSGISQLTHKLLQRSHQTLIAY